MRRSELVPFLEGALAIAEATERAATVVGAEFMHVRMPNGASFTYDNGETTTTVDDLGAKMTIADLREIVANVQPFLDALPQEFVDALQPPGEKWGKPQ